MKQPPYLQRNVVWYMKGLPVGRYYTTTLKQGERGGSFGSLITEMSMYIW